MVHLLDKAFSEVFLVGDTHGQYHLLQRALIEVGFDPTKGHVLVSVGDLIDRGPDSMKMLQLLTQPWFYSVLGNHEKMLLDSLNSSSETCIADRWNWQKVNGGDWFSFDVPIQKELQDLLTLIEALPLTMEIRSEDGSIGVIHANVPDNHWPTATELACSKIRKHILWSREKGQLARTITENHISSKGEHSDLHVAQALDDFPKIRGVDWVVFGHTIMPNRTPVQIANSVFLDVGAAKGLAPVVIRASDIVHQKYRLR